MDGRQRTRERHWRAGGSVEDEARWLVDRVRTRTLEVEALQLAACCDHPAAQQALAGLGVEASPTTWVTDVRRWGPAVCLRAALFAARRALPAWESAFAADERPARALRLVEDWLAGRDATGAPSGQVDASGEGAGEDAVPVDAERAAELCQRELAEAAEYAGSSAARRAEDACVAIYFAVRGLEAVARGSERELLIPAAWLRRRAARRALSNQPPGVIDDFLRAERRAARARHEAPAVTRAWINAQVAAWGLEE
jgi:hypothetical protein